MTQQLDAAFSALGDGTRRAILARLSAGEAPLKDLAEPFQITLTAVSKHVRVLQDAGLVTVQKRGRVRHCRLHGAPLKDAADWLADYRAHWQDQLDALGRHLAKTGTKK